MTAASATARQPRTSAGELPLIGGTLCAIVLWSTYAYLMSTPGVLDRAGAVKGWDFPQFYALGRLAALPDRGKLASGDAIGRAATETVSPSLASSRFAPVYAPQVALLFRPFARLAYLEALACWLILSLAIYAGCCIALWRSCPALSPYRAAATAIVIGAPVAFFVACYAQLSAVALALFTAAFAALKTGRPFIAGLAVGALVYKPQLGLAAGVVFLTAGEWRIVAGAVASALAQVVVAGCYGGGAALQSYVHTLMHARDDIALVQEKTHLLQSLSAFFDLILPWPRVALAATVVVAAGVLIAAWKAWTSDAPLALRFSIVLLATVLVSPHFYVYDLMILVPAGFLLADRLAASPPMRRSAVTARLLWLLYLVPVFGPIVAKTTHVQPTTLIAGALFAVLTREAIRIGELNPVDRRVGQ